MFETKHSKTNAKDHRGQNKRTEHKIFKLKDANRNKTRFDLLFVLS